MVSKSVLGCAGLALILLTTPALASSGERTTYEYATVIDSRPIYQIVEISSPREECWNEEVVVHRRDRSESSTPAILGTIIGGALGNAVGHGKSNRRVGTVVGAVLGHSIGRDIVTAGDGRDRSTHYETVRQCETVYEYREEERLIGYDVRYRYNNEEYSVQMDEEPGSQVRIRVNVQPVF
ncbi:MAG: glycine zipper 2TM domain-containing protein [Pseudomonadota bacterium]